MSAIPALAAAMTTILLRLRPGEADPPDAEGDELRLWLVAAALAVLMG